MQFVCHLTNELCISYECTTSPDHCEMSIYDSDLILYHCSNERLQELFICTNLEECLPHSHTPVWFQERSHWRGNLLVVIQEKIINVDK